MYILEILCCIVAATTVNGFQISFYIGSACMGEFVGSVSLGVNEHVTLDSDIKNNARSAVVVPSGSEEYDVAIFCTDTACTDTLAETDSGCVSFANNGYPGYVYAESAADLNSVVQNDNGRSTKNNTASILSLDDTFMNARRKAGYLADELPDVPEGYKWFTMSLGQWTIVPENETVQSFYSKYKFDYNAPAPNITFERMEDNDSELIALENEEKYNAILSSEAAVTTNLESRNLVSTCSVLYYCSLPFFAGRDAVAIYESYITPIIEHPVTTTLWGVANNGILIAFASGYYYLKTSHKVMASQCSTMDTDKDEMINALKAQLASATNEKDVLYSALAQCLDTNQSPAPSTGTLSLTGWTTMTRSSRCNTATCGTIGQK